MTTLITLESFDLDGIPTLGNIFLDNLGPFFSKFYASNGIIILFSSFAITHFFVVGRPRKAYLLGSREIPKRYPVIEQPSPKRLCNLC